MKVLVSSAAAAHFVAPAREFGNIIEHVLKKVGENS
jgi:hypothetical protein